MTECPCEGFNKHGNRAWRFTAVFVAWFVGTSCASTGVPALIGPPRTQPPELVGSWREQHAAEHGGRGEALVLAANAQQWTARTDSTAASPAARRIGRVAWWWVSADAGAESPLLCMFWRPGHHAASCARFQLDSVAANGAWRRHLTWGTRRYIAEGRDAVADPRQTAPHSEAERP